MNGENMYINEFFSEVARTEGITFEWNVHMVLKFGSYPFVKAEDAFANKMDSSLFRHSVLAVWRYTSARDYSKEIHLFRNGYRIATLFTIEHKNGLWIECEDIEVIDYSLSKTDRKTVREIAEQLKK